MRSGSYLSHSLSEYALGGTTPSSPHGDVRYRSRRVRRRVLIESYTTRSQDIVLANVSGSESSNISIPEHVGDVTVSILPTTNRTVQTIRADGRIVRHNPTGLSVQKHHISSSRHPLNLSIVSTGNTSGKLLIAWQTADTTLAWVEVRVGE
jgi:hypothetical protein